MSLDDAIAQLAQSDAELWAAMGNVTGTQWIWRPDAEVWSIGEIAEHLVLVERGILRRLRLAPSEGIEKTVGKEQILRHLTNRTRRIPAPARVLPSGRYANSAACLADLSVARAETLAWAQDPGTDLQQHVMRHLAFGELHGLQWLQLLAGHTMRHVLQMRELMALAGFPTA